jgi:hypothetical protein
MRRCWLGVITASALTACGSPPPTRVVAKPPRTGLPFVHEGEGRRVVGRVGDPVVSITWARCPGWSYRGPALDDLPHGAGRLTIVDESPFGIVEGTFADGQLTGVVHASVSFYDETMELAAELRIDFATCTIRNESVESELDGVPFLVRGEGPAMKTRFRGSVSVLEGQLYPVRGRVAATDETGYLAAEYGGFVATSAACLTASCVDGDGAELVGSGESFALFEGRFAGGLRHGEAVVHAQSPTSGVRSYSAQYQRGFGGASTWHRGAYRLGHDPFDADPASMRVIGFDGTLRVVLSEHGIVSLDTSDLAEETTRLPGLPGRLDPTLAAASFVARDLDRSVGTRCLGSCALTPYWAATDGPLTPAIMHLADAGAITEAWLHDRRQRITGVALRLDKVTGRFTGTARLDAGGTSAPVAFYRSVRIDPLGFADPDAYLAASPAARRKKAAALGKAAKRRAADDDVTTALKRVLDDAGQEQSFLAEATTALGSAASDAVALERSIRSAEVALEHASDAMVDAALHAETLLARLDASDPAREAVANLLPHLRDHDERHAMLLRAFAAFQASDDIDRLTRVRTMLAADVAALPTARLAAFVAALRDARDGKPAPLPD